MWIPTVKDIGRVVKQTHTLLTIKETATAAEAAKKMSDNQVGCLIVFDIQDKFAGVLTERDMLAKVVATRRSPDTVHVRDIMASEVISCSMDSPIGKVEQLMAEHKIRHLPIVEHGAAVGMVSSRDIIACQLHSNSAMKAAAEQLAMLSTGLKSLDFDDVITLAINEVPKSFEAETAVLCFDKKDSSAAMIYRKGCSVPEESLLEPARINELPENGQAIYGKICTRCAESGGRAPRLVIALSIREHCGDRSAGNVSRQGFLCMCRFNPSSIGSEELQLYKASLLREVLSVNLTNAKLYRDYQKVRRESEIDPLTGVGTRRLLEQILKSECNRAIRYNRRFSIAIVDVDNFKQINDEAGHAAGDMTLRELAKTMRSGVRTTDVVARYGGDEFVLLMPETKLSDAAVLLERLRGQVQCISIPDVQSITVSCGLAEWSGCDSDTAEALLKQADDALYEAKRQGRNRVVASQTAETRI